ncbi:MAG: hypothetical protein R2779_02160 [Crocinitomicaceae bacterium]
MAGVTGDEPKFTQPNLYKAIAKHKNPSELYIETLIPQGVLSREDAKKIDAYQNFLEVRFEGFCKTKKNNRFQLHGRRMERHENSYCKNLIL